MMESERKGEDAHSKPKTKMKSKAESDDGKEKYVPDGGWGWVVCFAGFMINFIEVGIVASNGIILLGLIDLFNESMSKTSMVGPLFLGISMCIGPLVLLLMKFNASHRQIIMLGGFFAAVATFASAFAENIEVLYVTYGFFAGTFIGLPYFAANTIVGAYFKKKRTLAVGIACSGSGCGAFALNYLVERSISFYGMRLTFVLMSGLISTFIVFGALCRPLTTIKEKDKKTEEETYRGEIHSLFEPDEKKYENDENANKTSSYESENPGHSEKDHPKNKAEKSSKCSYLCLTIIDPEIMKNTGMQWLLLVYFLWGACEVILLYLPPKAVSVNLSREQGAWIMSSYGGVFAFGNVFVGLLADLFDIPKSYILTFSLFGMSVTSAAFIFCDLFTLYVALAALFAVFHGFSTTLRVVLVGSIVGKENIDKGYSPLCFVIGVGYIIFPIIAGALYDATETFDVPFYFGSASLFISCISSIGIIYIQRNKEFAE